MKVHRLYDPYYQFKLNLFVGDLEEFVGLIKHTERVEDGTDGMFVVDEGYYYLWIADYSNVVVLAHEVLHLVLTILDLRAIPISKDNEEVIAYAHSWWMTKIMKTVRASDL